ncbi:T9SS type A sorting domain-containing protein, partial [bacterium]|nr:T9SS type A sorting domain-containing protein [bacterium]
ASGIYDISGKLVKNIPKNRMRISTKDFSPGLYFLVSNDREIKIKFVVLQGN